MRRNNILITGASSGLGEGMARQFAAQGRNLSLCARRTDRLDNLRAEITRDHDVRVDIYKLDVNEHDSVIEVFNQSRQQFGTLDRVIVNAGLGNCAPIGTREASRNLAAVQTNVLGALSQCEAALEIFREQGRGHLVLVSSISGDRGMPGHYTAYAASKAAVSSLGQGLAVEFAGSGIVISTLLPGYIRTPMSDRPTNDPMSTDLDVGVTAMVEAIERERRRVALPGPRWRAIDLLLRYGPAALTDPLVR